MKKIVSSVSFVSTVLALFFITACGSSVPNNENMFVAPTRYNIEASENPYDDIISFKDDSFYYYLFYLGDIQYVPLQENINVYKYDGRDYEFSITTKKSTSSSIEKQVTNVIEHCTDWMSSWSSSLENKVSASIGVGKLGASISANLEVGYSDSIETSKKITASESFTEAEEYTEEYSETFKFAFNNSFDYGYYRYILMGELSVYGVVIYDFKNDIYGLTNYSVLSACYFTFDYCESSAKFDNDNYNVLPFVFDEQYIKNLPMPNYSIYEGSLSEDSGETGTGNLPSEDLSKRSIDITFMRESCKLDNGFDPSASGTDKDILAHSTFDLFELVLSNSVKGTDGKYYVLKGQKPKLELRVLQNINKLPTGSHLGSVNWTIHNIADDNYDKSVYGTNISGQKLHKGAYYIKVNYIDGSFSEFNAVDILNEAAKNNLILLKFDINSNKILKSIEVVCVYELYYDYMSSIWNWGGTKCYANWRCSISLQFGAL